MAERWVKATTPEGGIVWVNMERAANVLPHRIKDRDETGSMLVYDGPADPRNSIGTLFIEPPEHFLPRALAQWIKAHPKGFATP